MNNEKLTYKVIPETRYNSPACIWKNIKAWLIIYTEDGAQVTSGTPYASEEGAKRAGELYVTTWNQYGKLAR
jgi:hypothetical protein